MADVRSIGDRGLRCRASDCPADGRRTRGSHSGTKGEDQAHHDNRHEKVSGPPKTTGSDSPARRSIGWMRGLSQGALIALRLHLYAPSWVAGPEYVPSLAGRDGENAAGQAVGAVSLPSLGLKRVPIGPAGRWCCRPGVMAPPLQGESLTGCRATTGTVTRGGSLTETHQPSQEYWDTKCLWRATAVVNSSPSPQPAPRWVQARVRLSRPQAAQGSSRVDPGWPRGGAAPSRSSSRNRGAR